MWSWAEEPEPVCDSAHHIAWPRRRGAHHPHYAHHPLKVLLVQIVIDKTRTLNLRQRSAHTKRASSCACSTRDARRAPPENRSRASSAHCHLHARITLMDFDPCQSDLNFKQHEPTNFMKRIFRSPGGFLDKFLEKHLS
jgi:hypothetical protein